MQIPGVEGRAEGTHDARDGGPGDVPAQLLLEGTQLIYLGDEETIQQAFSSEAKNNVVFLPGVMSRKKQIIPTLSAMWG